MHGNLHVERKGDSLVVRSKRDIGVRMVGALFAGFGLFMIWLTIRHALGGPGHFFGLMFAVVFVCFGVLLALPSFVTTVFDLRSRRVHHHLRLAWGWYERHRSYPFTEVAGMGIKEYTGEDLTYMPVMITTDGKTRWLVSENGYTRSVYADAIEAICAVTGLRKLALPRPRWWQWW